MLNPKNAERLAQHQNDLETGKPKDCCYRCSKKITERPVLDNQGHVVRRVRDSHVITYWGIANRQLKTEVCPACFLLEEGTTPAPRTQTEIVALPTHKDKKRGGGKTKGAPMLVKTSEPKVPLLVTYAMLGAMIQAREAHPEMTADEAIRAVADERAS